MVTSSTCPECGHTFDAHHAAHDTTTSTGTYQIVPDIGMPDAPTATSTASEQTTTGGGRWQALMAGAALLVAAIVASLLFFGTDDGPVADEVPEAPLTGSGDGVTNDGLGSTRSTEAEPFSPPSDAHLAADSVAALFRQVVDDDHTWSAIYPSPLGLQVLNASGANEPAVEVAVGFEEAARFPLISDGSTSWAINPSDLATAFLVSTQFVVIDIDREGRVGFINDSLEPPNIGESSFGAWGPGFDLPAGADVLAVPRRALFVLPATGGTYEYVMNGVVPYSDDVLVAASLSSEVFERCNDQLVCELYAVTPAQPDGVPLDFDVQSSLWIAPDGDLLVVQEPQGDAQLVWLATGERRPLAGNIRAVHWSDDGSRAAILSDTELTILMPDYSSASVTLPIEPTGAAVLLVQS